MKASMSALVAVLTITSLGLLASSASACGGGGYGGGYGGYGSYNTHRVYVKKVYVRPIVIEPCYYPFHCFAIVNPGDSWFTLSLREYGKPHLWRKIALFNGLPLNAGLIPGMQLKLPVIHPNGVLVPSSAPAPIALAAPAPIGLPQAGTIPGIAAPQANFIPQGGGVPQGANFAPQGATMNAPAMNPQMMNGAPVGTPNGAPNMGQPTGPMGTPNLEAPAVNAAPTANIRTVSAEPRLPSVAIGSLLTLDGQSLGNERGTVRLLVNGLALPIEVLEWNATSAKIQLPQLDLAGAIKAEIEVLRADGSRASKSAVELTPATNRLALGN